MSIQLMMDVWKSDLDRNCKAVALVYADAASDDGNGIYFSIEYAAWKSGYDHRSITRILRKLEDLGVLLFLGRSESQTKRYRFVADNLPQRPSWKEYKEQKTQGGDKMSSLGVTKCPPTPDKMSSNPTYYPTYSNLLISAGLENSIPDTAQDVLPVKEILEPNADDNFRLELLSTAYVEPVAPLDIATLVAETLPVEPTLVKEKTKPKKAAKAVKPPKAPKPPRELNAKELAFLAKIEQLNPLIAPDVKQRLNEYSRGIPWSVAQVFLLTSHMPKPNNWSAIVSINGVAFDEERMMECYNEWTLRGYSEYGLAWLTQWYKAGGPPARYGQQQQPTPTPTKPKIDISDPLVEDFAYWIMDHPGYGSKSSRSVQLAAWLATNGDYNVAAQHIGDIEDLYAEYKSGH